VAKTRTKARSVGLGSGRSSVIPGRAPQAEGFSQGVRRLRRSRAGV